MALFALGYAPFSSTMIQSEFLIRPRFLCGRRPCVRYLHY